MALPHIKGHTSNTKKGTMPTVRKKKNSAKKKRKNSILTNQNGAFGGQWRKK